MRCGTACHVPFAKKDTLVVDLIHGMHPAQQIGYLWLCMPTFYEYQSKKNGGKASFETTVEYEIQASGIPKPSPGNITCTLPLKLYPNSEFAEY